MIQQGWGLLDAKTRAQALHRIADSIERADPQDVAVLMTHEMGKPYPESVGEIANGGGLAVQSYFIFQDKLFARDHYPLSY
jgi:acyl-CoA reductase-like NAD-dependent aldehyde dehydrogenase